MHLHGIRVGQCAEAELKSCQRGGGSQREICLCSQELNILCLLFVVVVALVVTVVVFVVVVVEEQNMHMRSSQPQRQRRRQRQLKCCRAELELTPPRRVQTLCITCSGLVWPGLLGSA